jgi:hypothetical protein
MELQTIKDYIDKHKLNTPSRKREDVYARFVLYYHLVRIKSMGYTEVGRMFNRDHSSVIYGVGEYERIGNQNWFRDSTKMVRTFLSHDIDVKTATLRDEVINCESLIDLHRIQRLIKQDLL